MKERGKHQSFLRTPPTLETLEDRVVPSVDFYSIDGTDNNRREFDWGSTGVQLLRLLSSDYADDISAPAGELRPSARAVSNAVVAQTTSLPNDRSLADVTWLWGQFIDHDIDLTEAAEPHEPFNIEVPAGDPFFDPTGTGTATIELNRSVFDPSTSTFVPRQQINQITAFLDGSMIYGSDQARADALRTFSGGKLKTSPGNLLPFNVEGFANAGGAERPDLFLAGDVRANENAALSAMHTLFVREHNRIADELSARNGSLGDEQIYQRARSQVIAEIQAITYNEFLPALLGRGAISRYTGYAPRVNPGVSNVFSTASYRLGHSMLSSQLLRLDNAGNVIADGNLALRDAFFAPDELLDHGIDSLLRGVTAQRAQEIDSQVIDDVRNFLFGPPGSGGFDLASLNIQRGRDHGLPSYNQARMELGLTPATSFADITSDPLLQRRLASVYGSVEDVDLWVGALAEDHVPGASVGELNYTILVDQFTRLRDGDRFWYENQYRGATLAELQNTTLADILERNTNISGLRENVFFVEGNETPGLYPSNANPGVNTYVVGADAGGSPVVRILDTQTHEVLYSFLAYDEGFLGGVRVATGDLNGDGIHEIITAPGPGGGPHIRVFDGTSGALLTEFMAYNSAFTGGVFVALGDLDNDGFGDIITGAGAGGGPHVRAFSGGGKGTLADFFAYDAAFRGGVTVALGDLDNDGFGDIITGAGAGGGPHIRAFSGAGKGILVNFFAYDASFTGGVFVASGDLDNDGFDDIITGAGAGGGPHVRAFGGRGILADFLAYDAAFRGGVRVGAQDRDGDGVDDILTAGGPGGGSNVRIFEVDPFDAVDSFFAFDRTFGRGVFVG